MNNLIMPESLNMAGPTFPELKALDPIRYGWFLRQSTQEYEFWWTEELLAHVSVDLVDALPGFIGDEIRMSLALKGSDGNLLWLGIKSRGSTRTT